MASCCLMPLWLQMVFKWAGPTTSSEKLCKCSMQSTFLWASTFIMLVSNFRNWCNAFFVGISCIALLYAKPACCRTDVNTQLATKLQSIAMPISGHLIIFADWSFSQDASLLHKSNHAAQFGDFQATNGSSKRPKPVVMWWSERVLPWRPAFFYKHFSKRNSNLPWLPHPVKL